MNQRILYTKPSITELEVAYATDAAANGWGEHCYDYIHRFESGFAQYLGTRYAIATSSCTGAMHMGLAALEIGAGDEVILADTNWVATVAPVVHVGATPVFVDILLDSWCIDPQAAEAAITPRTRAIVATHLYGNLCEMDALRDIAKRHHLVLIEDAAEAIGSVYQGQQAGSMGHFGVFSFHGTKTITTGEGGMFVTSDPELYQRVLTLSNHGRKQGEQRQFWPEMIGFKYKMSNIQAAIGCAQLERIDELVARKREILLYYRNRLKKHTGLMINPEPENTINGAWMPTVVFDPALKINRESILCAFKKENIDARVFFFPLSGLDFFENNLSNKNSKSISDRAINLPSFYDITDVELNRVCDVIDSIVNNSEHDCETGVYE